MVPGLSPRGSSVLGRPSCRWTGVRQRGEPSDQSPDSPRTWPRATDEERVVAMNHILAAGTPAPDFALHATPDQILKLHELRGRPVIIAFYPADWRAVCSDQMALY